MSPDHSRIRLELDQRRARGVHAAIHEAINAKLLTGDRLDAAREVLEQLDGRAPASQRAAANGDGAVVLVAAPEAAQRDGGADEDAWIVRDADALLDLVYAEHSLEETAHRASVQAIGRLEDRELGQLVDVLIGRRLLKTPDVPVSLATWLELTPKGVRIARQRRRDAAPRDPSASDADRPTPRPPFQRRLPLRIHRDDRAHPVDLLHGANWCPQASWLQRSSTTKLFAALKRDGAVPWTCPRCDLSWLVYLQAFTADGEPAYGDPTGGAYNRPLWRPTFRDSW